MARTPTAKAETIFLRNRVILGIIYLIDRCRNPSGKRLGGAWRQSSLSASFASLLLVWLTACGTPPDHPNRVPLSGAPNFRDVGGYATADGRRVKRGLLYRSSDLADLNKQDVEILRELDLKRIYDLRSIYEKTSFPSVLPADDPIKVVEIPIYYPPLDRRESKRKILTADVEPGHFRQLLTRGTRAMALHYLPEWSKLLETLAQDDALPSLIHCTDGKDRTGFAVAIVLRALGVPKDVILEDYLLSNTFLQHKIGTYSSLASLGSLFRVPASEVRPLLGVRREYLEAAFTAIDERYGSFDAYLQEGLQLDDQTLDRLRLALLE